MKETRQSQSKEQIENISQYSTTKLAKNKEVMNKDKKYQKEWLYWINPDFFHTSLQFGNCSLKRNKEILRPRTPKNRKKKEWRFPIRRLSITDDRLKAVEAVKLRRRSDLLLLLLRLLRCRFTVSFTVLRLSFVVRDQDPVWLRRRREGKGSESLGEE